MLKNYSRQLSQGKMLARNKGIGRTYASADDVQLSSEGKRAAIIEKVAANIVDRITTFGQKEDVDQEITGQIEKELGQRINFTRKKEEKFSYTTIDENNNKTVKTLSVEDSEFIIKRMTELARKAADNNMES